MTAAARILVAIIALTVILSGRAAAQDDLLLHNGTPPKSTLDKIFTASMRIKPVNDKLRTKLHGVMDGYIPLYRNTPWAGAYALDDEISWGHFVYPAMWKITDDESAYPKWLEEIYGRGNAPKRDRWVTYEEIWPKLSKWRVRDFDVSALMDQLTFNDSHWNNFIGELVGYANTCITDKSGFNLAVRKMGVDHVATSGKGKAVLINLSPQWYTAYRQEGFAAAQKRDVFTKHALAAARPWVRLVGAGEKEFGHEFTYFTKGRRTIVWLCFAPAIRGTSVGGGNAATLKTDTIGVTIRFAGKITGVRNERTGKLLGDGREFKLNWTMNRAVVLSFDGKPPR